MKRKGNLFDHFVSFANLLKAYHKAKKGTRKNEETGYFFVNLEAELFQLQAELQSMCYQPQPYRYFEINDPKQRTISVAAFRDRVVHHGTYWNQSTRKFLFTIVMLPVKAKATIRPFCVRNPCCVLRPGF